MTKSDFERYQDWEAAKQQREDEARAVAEQMVMVDAVLAPPSSQGFPDDFEIVSDAQIRKQAGKAVPVPMIQVASA